MNHLRNVPLAIFANKADLVDITEEDLASFIGINKNMSRAFSIFKISSETGEGIHKGICWLAEAIQEGKPAPRDLYQIKALHGRLSTFLGSD